MEDGQDIINFTSEDGSVEYFSVIEQVTIAGVNYILVTDIQEEVAYILKEVREDGEDTIYEILEDEQELDSISKVFEETLDDVDIEI